MAMTLGMAAHFGENIGASSGLPQGGSSLPQDHEDQMQLGMRIVQNAFTNKVQALEQEISRLRFTNEEQRANVTALQKKTSALEVELVESHQRSQQLAEENKELFKTVGSLRKQIGRLEHLKAAVMSSIQDDAEKEAENGETRALMNEEYLRNAAPLTSHSMGFQAAPPMYSSPGFAPTSTPGGMGMDYRQPGMMTSQPSPVVDGKEFFRHARSQLSHEVFNQFLQSIKRLNSQQQSREETLDETRRLFGPENQTLYQDFEALLNRQGL